MINIYGKGDHSRVVSSAIRHPKKIMFWDDKDFRLQPEPWVIAIGDNKARKRIAEKVILIVEKNKDRVYYIGHMIVEKYKLRLQQSS